MRVGAGPILAAEWGRNGHGQGREPMDSRLPVTQVTSLVMMTKPTLCAASPGVSKLRHAYFQACTYGVSRPRPQDQLRKQVLSSAFASALPTSIWRSNCCSCLESDLCIAKNDLYEVLNHGLRPIRGDIQTRCCKSKRPFPELETLC